MLVAREEASELGFVCGHVQRLDSNCECRIERYNYGVFNFCYSHGKIVFWIYFSFFIENMLRSIYSSHSVYFTDATCILHP